jgi:DNA-binding CsgD family transcriptional regulator
MRGEATMTTVGRERELALIHEALGDGDPPRALVLMGGPGIGKTTIWEAAAAAARKNGIRVLSARASEAEARLSFNGLVDLLDEVGPEELTALSAPQRRVLEVALLRADPDGPPADRHAVALGLLNTIRSLAEHQPVLIAVDDVPWLDRPSAEALAFAARRVGGRPVSFLLARRSGAAPALERALAPNAPLQVEIDGLSLGAMRRMLAERLGLVLSRRLLWRVFESTDGNPLFALEVGRTLVGRGEIMAADDLPVPETVEDLLGVRVKRLPRAVRRLVLAVALSGELRISELALLADAAALDSTVEAGLLVVEGGRARTAHPLIAEVAKSRSPAAERRALHAELAATATEDELRARHLALAADRPDDQLADTLSRAAATAAARGAAEDAVELAEHALGLTAPVSALRPDRVLALAEHLVVAGERARAIELLAPEADLFPSGSSRVRAHLLLADSRFTGSHVDASGAHLERALAESEGDPALRATVMARRSRYFTAGRVERIADAEAWAVEALPAGRDAGPQVEREVLFALGFARMLQGRPIDDLCERFRAISDDAFPIIRSLDRIAPERLACRGHVAPARAALLPLLQLARERGDTWSYGIVRQQLCGIELFAGELENGAELLADWEGSPDDLHPAEALDWCRALLAVGRGLQDDAERHAAAALAAAEASGYRWDVLAARWIGGLAAASANDHRRAAESLGAVWEHMQRAGIEDPGVFPVAPDLVEALVESGEVAEARAVTTRLRTLAEEQQHPWGLVAAKRCQALLQLAAHEDVEAATSALREAAAAYDELGLPLPGARTLLVLGRAERRLRRWADARASLEQAAAAFEAIGSPGWAQVARSELQRLSGRRPGAAEDLTATERRVVELAAEGLANKEIAAALFVTVHTVEAHLSHAYAKLGVRSRGRLASRLAGRS